MVKRAWEPPLCVDSQRWGSLAIRAGFQNFAPALTLSFKPLSLEPPTRKLMARSPED